jgi:hypothetical protein
VIDTGKPILVDLLSNQAGTFSSAGCRCATTGGVIGALGMVLLDQPETTMQPLMAKFARLQRELDAARRQLAAQRRPKYRIASYIGNEQRGDGGQAPGAPRRPDRLHRAAAGRDRHRQGAAGARHPRRQRARGQAASWAVNIAAMPESLLEAEFFGVAPGAYTGADRKGRDGKFKAADGGTLFLDEIGDMPLALQSKLLRVLQEQEFEPLGSNQVQRVDVRVIAATSRDLACHGGRWQRFAPTCITGSTCCRSACRRCASGCEDLEAAGRGAGRGHRAAQRPAAQGPERRTRSSCWRGSPGRATSASCATCSNRPTLMTDDTSLGAGHFQQDRPAGGLRKQTQMMGLGWSTPPAAR